MPPSRPSPSTTIDDASASAESAREIESLITAAWTVAARAGTTEPSVREILDHAGVSTNVFYRHFRSKNNLLIQAFDQGTRLLVDFLEQRMDAHDDPFDSVQEWIEGFVRQATPPAARRTLPWSLGIGRLVMQFPDTFDRNQAAMVAPLQRAIQAAVDRGASDSPDAGRDAWLIFGYTVDTVRRHLVHRTTPDGATLRQLVSFAHRALGRAAQPAQPAQPA